MCLRNALEPFILGKIVSAPLTHPSAFRMFWHRALSCGDHAQRDPVPPNSGTVSSFFEAKLDNMLGQPARVLGQLRASLNALSRFNFGHLAALAHAREWQAKERGSHETV
jgi:hypothetical protein